MQRLHALWPHGRAGQVLADVPDVPMSVTAWWDLEDMETPQPVPLPLLLSCCRCPPAVTPAPRTSTRGSVKNVGLVPHSSKKDYLCVSPNSAKVVV